MREWKSQEELRLFLMPALRLRIRRLEASGKHMTAQEIFAYLKEKKWKNDSNLHLYEMVDDILHYEMNSGEE